MCDNGAKFLRKVYLAADVYAVCLQHALTTEKEEIMGLLLGEADEENRISHVSSCIILHRSDKQPDRVEISPEQLCTAFTYAEELTQKLNRPLRVLGWYHSHPHITVWPSHVDVRTQAMYQTMDPLFVGLIFSVYQTDANLIENQIQLTCFQATGSGANAKSREVELHIKNSVLAHHNLEGIAELPKILAQEETGTGDKHNDEDYLSSLHNDALKTLTLVNIVSNISKPMLEDLEERLVATKTRLKELEQIKQQIMSQDFT